MDLKNTCIICGLNTKDLKNQMCKVCTHLSEEKFYEIENEFIARKYFKDYIRKDPNKTIAVPKLTEDIINAKGETETITHPAKTASQALHDQFKNKPVSEWIHGIMPSKCPFCQNLSTNRGMIQTIKRDSEDFQKIVVQGIVPHLVCKACGDFSLYLNHVYDFSREQSIEMLKKLKEIRIQNKEQGLIACQNCAKGLGKKEDYEKSFELSEEEKKLMAKHNRKHICRSCLDSIKGEKKSE